MTLICGKYAITVYSRSTFIGCPTLQNNVNMYILTLNTTQTSKRKSSCHKPLSTSLFIHTICSRCHVLQRLQWLHFSGVRRTKLSLLRPPVSPHWSTFGWSIGYLVWTHLPRYPCCQHDDNHYRSTFAYSDVNKYCRKPTGTHVAGSVNNRCLRTVVTWVSRHHRCEHPRNITKLCLQTWAQIVLQNCACACWNTVFITDIWQST